MRPAGVENYHQFKTSLAQSTEGAIGRLAQMTDRTIGFWMIPDLLKKGKSTGRGNSTSDMRRLSVDRIESTLQTDS